jgi:integrase
MGGWVTCQLPSGQPEWDCARAASAWTTLTYYAAWIQEADQRACHILKRRLPFPTPPLGVAAPSRLARPLCPYQVIAAEMRTAILDGTQPAGTTLPTVKQLAARHHVAASTAHRAIAVLAAENLITVSRGRRPIVTRLPPSLPTNRSWHDRRK